MRRKLDSEQSRTLPDMVVDRIRASLARWRPGLWAEENNYGPACTCGLNGRSMPLGTGYKYNPERVQTCQRHPSNTPSTTSHEPTETT